MLPGVMYEVMGICFRLSRSRIVSTVPALLVFIVRTKSGIRLPTHRKDSRFLTYNVADCGYDINFFK